MTNKFNHETFNKDVTWRILNNEPKTWFETADETEREELRKFMYGLLHERDVQVEFAKVDGTIRSMRCTLQESVLPKINIDNENEIVKDNTNPNVCRVWDCDVGAWRSFRWDRLKRIDFSIG